MRDNTALLVLDNCEHLVEACASAVHELLRHCPTLRVLATSQRPLGIEGEQRFRVSLLALPPAEATDPAVLQASPAVRLLLARASECDALWRCESDALPDAAGLCRQLDGNALAIELAAVRVVTLGLAATRAALADRFGLPALGRREGLRKHQSLDAMIDWSHGLLPEPQRAALRRLAVFAGGWTAASAGAVIGGTAGAAEGTAGDGTDIASTLADLVERSLIACDSGVPSPRFRMLEAQRAYTLGKLRASGEYAAYAAAHARHFCAVFEAGCAAWDHTADSEWVARYGPERDNLRSAIRFSLEAADAALAARLVGASVWLWRAIGAVHELQQILEHPLLRSAQALPGRCEARLRLAQAYSLHATSTESLRVKAAAEQAVAAHEGLQDPIGAANARLCLASAYAQLGDTVAHRACLGRADALLGQRRHGKTYGAITVGEESATRLAGRHHRDDHGRALANLGAARLARGELEAARDCWSRALHELRGLDFSYWVFDHIALLAIAEGRDDDAAHLVGYADAGYSRLRKGKRVQNEQRAHARAMAHLASRFDADALAALLGAGADASEDDVIAVALQRQASLSPA